jgi:glycosyltransferase involved in cell wall biosynthesis
MAALGAEVTLVTSIHFELAHVPRRFELDTSMRLWPPVEGGRNRRENAAVRRLRAAARKARRAVRAAVLVREWTRLLGRLLRERPDVAQFGEIHFPFQAVFLAALRRRGLVLGQVCHEFEAREQDSASLRRLKVRLSRAVYEQFALIAFLSDAVRRDFERAYGDLPAHRITIPHGNEDLFRALRVPGDPRARYGLPDEAQVVLFFGGVRPSKGVGDLVEAFARLPRDPLTRLVVAGYPSREMRVDVLRKRVERLGVADRVTLDLRYIEPGEVAGVLELAAVVALPYRSATQSGVVQLAYSFGRPVVATAVGGLAEAVEEGRSGLLVPPEDPAALAAALARLLGDPELRRRLGERGAELSRTRHAWTDIAAVLLAGYGEVLAAGKA